MFRTLPAAAAALLLTLAPALAADVSVDGAYARSSNPKVGGAFFVMHNASDLPARLVGAETAVATKAELHTHLMQDGIARMRPVDAIEIPAHGVARLQRGGDHVMLMGLTGPLTQGETFDLTLIFDDGTRLVIDVPVDNEHQEAPMDHGAMGHGAMKKKTD